VGLTRSWDSFVNHQYYLKKASVWKRTLRLDMQTSRYGSVPPSPAALMLLSDMSAHGIPSTEDCTAIGVCAWQMMVHFQPVLSQH